MTQQLRSLLNPEPQEESKSESVSAKYVIQTGLFLVALISFLTNVKEIPTWVWIALSCYLGISLIVVSVPYAKLLKAKWRERSRRREAARLFFPRLTLTFHRLDEHLRSMRSDTLLSELRDFGSIQDSRGQVVISGLYDAINIAEWLTLKGQQITGWLPREFLSMVQALDLAVIQYDRLCKTFEVRIQEVISNKLLDQDKTRQLRVKWNAGRETQLRFMQDWIATGQEINQLLGQNICQTYYQKLRPME